ncbi:Hint domain-containing protein [Pseudovibrio sp. Tun.PSC04-5.I4]|uniref:Hint domain-containing protein n=1 Tax=Pseudovibrio sp. Tun.PSC04-5.I4 TaxID=1798213 RepID=UPI0008902503|nr:Hint domain-containing protein [Pseudovibrio sp. Tun.PSC04-5.I4]SDQ14797.1 hypothetical protein SAMN04515695_0175 [Pseudovibrio sp. Tun.PSC04-5.I4]
MSVYNIAAEMRLDLIANLEKYKGEFDQKIAELPAGLSGALTSTDEARVIGVYIGVSPGVPSPIPGLSFVGGEGQILVGYDTLTRETKVFAYGGVTVGGSAGLPGLKDLGNVASGYFMFDGPLSEIPGPSYGLQAATGISVGYSRSPSGFSMVQIGAEWGAAAELTLGYTFGASGELTVDWIATEKNLRILYSDIPNFLEEMLVELALAKSLGGEYRAEFIEKYDLLIAGGCFLAGTPILLSDGHKKPIEEIVIGDVVQSYNAVGKLVSSRVTKIYRKQSQLSVLDVFSPKALVENSAWFKTAVFSEHKARVSLPRKGIELAA